LWCQLLSGLPGNYGFSLAVLFDFVVLMFFLLFIFLSRFGLGFKKAFLFLVVYFLTSIPLNATLRFFVKTYSIPAGSMENALQIGDYLLSDQFYYGHSFFNQTSRYFQLNQPQRGDIIVFLFPPDRTKDYIKRCVGIPGDVIELKNAVLYVNGAAQVEPYVKHIQTPAQALAQDGSDSPKVNFKPVTVEPGHYFMMGDNRDNSYDSRYWGQLDEKLIKGKAELTPLFEEMTHENPSPP
jgi:signal peptidase I